MRKLIATAALLAAFVPTMAQTSGKKSQVQPCDCAALRAENQKLRAQLAKLRSSDPEEARVRKEALASLRAVRSALNGGANVEMFRKYQIESRIKIDALPETSEQSDLREVSELFGDALAFWIGHITGTIGGEAFFRAQSRFKSDAKTAENMKKMNPFSAGNDNFAFYNKLYSDSIRDRLLTDASEKLTTIKR